MTGGRKSVLAGRADEGGRLDLFISTHAAISRSKAQRLISDGLVLLDGEPARKNHSLAAGEEISWEIPAPEPEEIVPEEAELEIFYEDGDIIVVDKPAEMVMYPGPGHAGGTLLNALLARYPDIAGVGGKGRPGVFHRLDRGTSGLVAVARSERAYEQMVEEMRDRQVERVYNALVVGSMASETGTQEPNGARLAATLTSASMAARRLSWASISSETARPGLPAASATRRSGWSNWRVAANCSI